MVIMGPKIVPDEEPKSEGKSQIFSVRWMKEFSQIFSSSDRIDEDGVGTSENQKKKKNGWNLVRISRTKQFSFDQEQIGCRCFNYKQLKAATANFSPANIIGRGGFGPVYKGILPDKTAVAVKTLSSSSKQGQRQFLAEINVISKLRHTNLVRLLGHCAVCNKLLLVYEYMENSCLATALSGSRPSLKERLNWQAMFQICIGIARGLAYLHEGAAFRVIHRDIKLSNVLLDKDLNPKIADFGLARLLPEEETHISTCVAGTFGKRCFNKSRDDSPRLLEFATALQKKGDLISLIDENLKTSISVKEAIMVLDLAMLCTAFSPDMRPGILEVVKTLEGKTTVQTSILLGSDDLTSVDSDEMTMIGFPDNYIDNTTTEMVTRQGETYSERGEDVARVLSSDDASNEEEDKTYNASHEDIHSNEKDSISEGGHDSRLRVYTNDLTSETSISNAKASTPSTFEDVGCNKWKNSLVGCFLSETGAFDFDEGVDEDVVREAIGNIMVVSSAQKGYSVSAIGSGHFLLRFSCDDDKIRVLESSGLLHIQGKTLIFRKWDWKLKFDKIEMLKSIHTWVKILNLPLFLWNSSFLSKLQVH
ncbi:hypothetical protein MKX03_017950 [Papaver bracteatum]|nr:hypothetical protein MKX03_017950 [Papaver bracteatum]